MTRDQLWRLIARETLNRHLPPLVRNLNAMHVADKIIAASRRFSASGIPLIRSEK